MTAGEVAAHFARRWIRPAVRWSSSFRRTLRKRSSRYRLKIHNLSEVPGACPGFNDYEKRRSANLHHLCCEALPEDTVLTPQVEIDNIHQRHTTDV